MHMRVVEPWNNGRPMRIDYLRLRPPPSRYLLGSPDPQDLVAANRNSLFEFTAAIRGIHLAVEDEQVRALPGRLGVCQSHHAHNGTKRYVPRMFPMLHRLGDYFGRWSFMLLSSLALSTALLDCGTPFSWTMKATMSITSFSSSVPGLSGGMVLMMRL